MRTRSPRATQEAIVGIVLIAVAAAILALSLQSGWAGPALASTASSPATASAMAAAGPVSTEASSNEPRPGEQAAVAATSSMSSSATTTSSRQATPLLVEVPSIAVKAAITAYTPAEVAANGGAVKPPTLFSVSWWTGGGDPGLGARNTVYLYGHTWKEPAVFNRIKELRPGDHVVVTTTAGRLVYVVDGSFTVDKPGLVTNPRVTQAVAGRLLLIGCYRATGHEAHTTANIVVTTHLLV